ncbi:MAG: alanine racemase [Oscillospiraceae bacterium]|nr:alanine racemase [Oscillospiraceae bacterium]
MEEQKKRAWAEIDLGHLEHNYRALRAMLPPGCRFAGLVKANAYGHGAVPVAKKLESLGADYLLVACLDEAVELRRAGLRAPILILGPTPEDFAPELLEYGLTQTVQSLPEAQALSRAAQKAGRGLKIHLKADTGMSRLGFLCQEDTLKRSAQEMAQVAALPGLEAEGVFTHFANADGDEAYSMLQLGRFLALKEELAGLNIPIWHCAASAATLRFPCAHMDMVRPGIALYGHYPDPALEGLDGPGLLPVMTLKARIAAVRELPAGTCISYGCTYTLNRDSRLAVLPVGYGDGLERLLSNRGEALIAGQRVPILGRVCMDICMVDVTDLPQVEPGQQAILFCPQLPLEEKAQAVGTIQYELLCGIAPRVPRVYLHEKD